MSGYVIPERPRFVNPQSHLARRTPSWMPFGRYFNRHDLLVPTNAYLRPILRAHFARRTA